MTRVARTAATGAAALGICLTSTACEESRIILGDAPGIVRIVVGVPDERGANVTGDALTTTLTSPVGLAVGPDGMLYLADRGAGRVLEVSPGGEIRDALANVDCGDAPCLDRPTGLAFASADGLLVADAGRNRILRIALDASNAPPAVIAGNGDAEAATEGAIAVESPLQVPFDVDVDDQGQVYFSERGGHVVWTIISGRLTRVAGTGIGDIAGDGGPAEAARLSSPAGIALHEGTLYIADSGNHVVRAVSLEAGTIRRVAGTSDPAFDGDGGPAIDARLNTPEDIAVSADGRSLYVADANNHRIRVVNLQGGSITTFAGSGETSFNGDLLPAGETALDRPAGIAIGAGGVLFIADTNHAIVRRTPIRF